ncbi:hypothetical protein AB6E02_12875 [Vibrio cyclitrophicus]
MNRQTKNKKYSEVQTLYEVGWSLIVILVLSQSSTPVFAILMFIVMAITMVVVTYEWLIKFPNNLPFSVIKDLIGLIASIAISEGASWFFKWFEVVLKGESERTSDSLNHMVEFYPDVQKQIENGNAYVEMVSRALENAFFTAPFATGENTILFALLIYFAIRFCAIIHCKCTE